MLVRHQKNRIVFGVLLLFTLFVVPAIALSFYLLVAAHDDTLSRYHLALSGGSTLQASSLAPRPEGASTLSALEASSRADFRKKAFLSAAFVAGAGLFTALFTTFIVMRRVINPFLSIGEQVRDIATAPDFTGRIRLEVVGEFGEITDAFNRQMELLEKKDRQLFHARQMEMAGLMAGGMSHEFNTILTSVRGFAERIRNRIHSGDDVRDYIEHILAATARGQHITKNLLGLRRDGIVTPQKIAVSGLLREVVAANEKIVGDGVKIALVEPPEGLTVLGDRHYLFQVFQNMISNARDAMTGGGRLSISAGVVEGGHVVKDGARQKVRHVEMAITDTGPGMDEAVLERIFQPFFTTKEPGHGTGLGLSISYAIIREHGGFITVRSGRGKGTSVIVTLPLVADDEEAAGGITGERPGAVPHGALTAGYDGTTASRI